MKLSKKGRYAVTAIMDLVLKAPYGPTTLNNISVSQEISMSYMEQLFARLRRSGLVKGTRGPGGGYRLAKAPNEITIAEILEAVDDGSEGLETPTKQINDLSHMLWDELSDRVFEFLKGITIQDLLESSALAETEAAAQPKGREATAAKPAGKRREEPVVP